MLCRDRLEAIIAPHYDSPVTRGSAKRKLGESALRDTASNHQNAIDHNRRFNMNRYEDRIPRSPFAFAAVALTVITLGLSVFLPSRFDMNAARTDTLIADTPTRVERIDVIAVRASKVAAMHGGIVQCKPQES